MSWKKLCEVIGQGDLARGAKAIERWIDLGQTIEQWAADVAIGVTPADFHTSLDHLLKREAKRIEREAVRRRDSQLPRPAVYPTGSRWAF